MKLTAKARRGPGVVNRQRAQTTEPGFENPNGQVVVSSTGAPSSVRDSQVIYKLRCNRCKNEYGCNGMDIKARLCPKCQGGVPGEVLRESQQTSLFG
jgi:hypothetical protein